MKKLISVLLVMTIILSCLALVGCEWFGGEQTTATTTTTTAPPPVDPSTIVLKQGNELNEEDIEFIKNWHGVDVDFLYSPKILSFGEIVTRVQKDNGHLYFVDVDLNNVYYLCGYYDPNVEFIHHSISFGAVDVRELTWYKFYDREEVTRFKDDLELGYVFQLCNATIKRDIKAEIDYDHHIKIYGFEIMGLPKPFDVLYEHTIMYWGDDVEDIRYMKEVRHNEWYFPGGVDENGDYYFMLKYIGYGREDGTIDNYEDLNRNHLKEYYDILLPYFEIVESLIFESERPTGETVTRYPMGIPLDIFVNILFEGEKN